MRWSCVHQVRACTYYAFYSLMSDFGGGWRFHSAFTHRICQPHSELWKRRPLADPKWTLPLLLLIWHSHSLPFFREEIQVKHSQILVEHCKAISPQSSGWNPLQLNNFLHLVSTPHRHPCSIITLLSWHQSQPLSRSPILPEWWRGGYDHSFVPGYNLNLNEKHSTKNHSRGPKLCL